MELIIAFIIAMVLLWLAAEPETLADYSDRMHVNRLAEKRQQLIRLSEIGDRPEGAVQVRDGVLGDGEGIGQRLLIGHGPAK